MNRPRDFHALLSAGPWAIREETLDALLASVRDAAPEALATKDGRPLDNADRATVREGVAILPVRGAITRYDSFYSWLMGGNSLETLAADFQAALDDPQVGAILLDVNSPGGQAAGIEEMAQRIRAAGKPVWAYIEAQGASAAYWLAAACDRVVVSRAALVGSIGVVMTSVSPDPSSRVVRFVSSQSPGKVADPATQAGRDRFQTLVDDMAAVFVADVASLRGIPEEDVLAVEGGMLVGQKAVDAGLADACGTFEDCLAELAGKVSTPAPAGRFGGRAAPFNAQAGEENLSMSLWDKIKAALEGAGVKCEDDAAQPEAAAAVAGREDAEKAQLRAQLADARKEGFTAQAEALFTAELAASRVFPAEKAEFVREFVQAACDDTLSPLAEGSRLDTFRARQGKRVAHNLTQEQLQAMAEGDPAAEGQDAGKTEAAADVTALGNKANTTAKEQAPAIDARGYYAARAQACQGK